MATHFFGATASANKQITEMYDFVWPTATAMWNLRWQVGGYVQVVPDATVTQLRARFSEGADIHGANLRRACIEHSWEKQKESFAQILLTNTIAIYEGWIEEVLDGLGKNTRDLRTWLQFPDDAAHSTGVNFAIADIAAVESAPLKNNFYASLCAGNNYNKATMNPMMLCYRFFKEMRNCQMHGGGVIEQRLVDAYTNFLPVANAAALGVGEVPKHAAAVLDGNVNLSLRGVVGFSHIVLKIMATLDAELSRSEHAEKVFCKRWKQTHRVRLTMPADPERRKSRVNLLVHKAGFPKPSNPADFGTWLKNAKLTYD
jgi:hypothetical protein